MAGQYVTVVNADNTSVDFTQPGTQALLTNIISALANVTVGTMPSVSISSMPGVAINSLPNSPSASPFIVSAGKPTNTVVKSSPGTLYGITITSVGLGSPTLFDNSSAASGNPVAFVPASAILGLLSQVPPIGASFLNGLTVQGGATNPGMIVWYL